MEIKKKKTNPAKDKSSPTSKMVKDKFTYDHNYENAKCREVFTGFMGE